MNIYKTKNRAEQAVNDYSEFRKVFFNYAFDDDVVIKNKKVLIIDADPLVYSIDYSNDLIVFTTNETNYEALTNKFNNLQIFLIDKAKAEKQIKEKLEQLKMKFNYIFGNPAYDDTLHLKIANISINYLEENGSCNLIEPLSAFCLKDNKYVAEFPELFKHVRSYKIIDPKHHKLFESCNTFQDIGIIKYVPEETSFVAAEEWKKYYPDIVNNIRIKIHQSNIPTLDDVRTKTLNRGIVVPLSHIGSVKGCVYKNFIYINDGMVKVLKTKKQKNKNVFEKAEYVPLDKIGRSPETGIPMKTIEQAIRWHYEYYHNPILKGLDWLSHLGSARRKPSLVPYFSFENETTEKEICKELNFTEDEIAFIKQCSCKDFRQNHFKTEYYKEVLF